MNFFGRVKCVFSSEAWEKAVRDFLTGDGPPPESILSVAGKDALKSTAVFGCARVLGETFASVPVHEYTKNKENDDREKTDETGIADKLRYRPNEEMSAFSFKELGMYQLNLGGNFICSKEVAYSGKLLNLNPIDGEKVTIRRNPDTKKIEYKIEGDGKTYFRKSFLHIPGPSFDGIVGLSPIEYAAQSIRLGLTYEHFSNNFFKYGALSTGMFEHPKFLEDKAYTRLKEKIKDNWSGLANSGKPMLLEDGLKFTPLNIKLADSELLQSKRYQVEDICRIYRVPLHLVQNLERATFSNIEQQSLEFVMYTMLPWFKRWEDAINSQLLSEKDYKAGRYIEFNMSGLLRGDSKSMAEAFALGRQWGYLSVNDIRRMLNLNGIGPAGDIYLQPMNMIEAGKEIPPDEAKKTLEQKKIVDEVMRLIEMRK
jgi:HK97 family phage portal protein